MEMIDWSTPVQHVSEWHQVKGAVSGVSIAGE